MKHLCAAHPRVPLLFFLGPLFQLHFRSHGQDGEGVGLCPCPVCGQHEPRDQRQDGAVLQPHLRRSGRLCQQVSFSRDRGMERGTYACSVCSSCRNGSSRLAAAIISRSSPCPVNRFRQVLRWPAYSRPWVLSLPFFSLCSELVVIFPASSVISLLFPTPLPVKKQRILGGAMYYQRL